MPAPAGVTSVAPNCLVEAAGIASRAAPGGVGVAHLWRAASPSSRPIYVTCCAPEAGGKNGSPLRRRRLLVTDGRAPPASVRLRGLRARRRAVLHVGAAASPARVPCATHESVPLRPRGEMGGVQQGARERPRGHRKSAPAAESTNAWRRPHGHATVSAAVETITAGTEPRSRHLATQCARRPPPPPALDLRGPFWSDPLCAAIASTRDDVGPGRRDEERAPHGRRAA